VLPSGPSTGAIGTDAGIWISHLTKMKTIYMPFNIDFGSRTFMRQLCAKQIDYIYVGSAEQSFRSARLRENPAWYTRVLSLPTVQLYQVEDCLSTD